MIYAAIVAGGTGSRMGADIPKQFLELCGKPILIYTIEAFIKSNAVDMIYIGVHSDWTEFLYDKCCELSLPMDRIRIVKGGTDRNSTVFNIIDSIKENYGINDEDIILTHDGVRPFVTGEIISENIKAMDIYDACATATESTDTILYSENRDIINNVPDRSKLFRAQTPQTFRLQKLCSAYESLDDDRKRRLTDTASIFTFAGLDVAIVKGDERNIKLTHPFDLLIGETIIKNNNL